MPRRSRQSPPPRSLHYLLVSVLVFSLLLNVALLVRSWHRSVVVSVSDGDSLVLADGRRIRLLGVDAPEAGRCQAAEAAEFLRQNAINRHVRLKHVTADSFDRTLAMVIVEDPASWFAYMSGRYFNSMRCDTHAGERSESSRQTGSPERVLPKPCPVTKKAGWWLIDALKYIVGLAKGKDGAGINNWQDPHRLYDPLLNRALVARGLAKYIYTAPPEYKETMKAAHDYARTHHLGIYSPACRSSISSDRDSPRDKGDLCRIKANVRQGKKTYFLPSCSNYDDVIIDTSFGDAWLCTEQEARQAGFTKSPTCR